MNIATLTGITLGFIVLGFSIVNATGTASLFWNPAGLSIVLGGITAALFICYPINDIRHLLRSFSKVLNKEPLPIKNYVEQLIKLSQIGLQKGKNALEDEGDKSQNFFLKDGLRMIADQYTENKIRQIMEASIQNIYDREMSEAEIFRTMAKMAPAFGMVGSLIGLIVMFQNIDQDPSAIGPSIAIAMMSTLYGLLAANLLFNPVAIKMERHVEGRIMLMQVIMEGVVLISKMTPPEIVKDELKVYLPQKKWNEIEFKQLRPAKGV